LQNTDEAGLDSYTLRFANSLVLEETVEVPFNVIITF
jgi:hypothetical protein